MVLKKIVQVALTSLLSQKLRAFFMTLGILISIATITIVVSLGQGAQQEVSKGVAKMGQSQTVMVTPGTEAHKPGTPRNLATSTLTIDDATALKNEIQGVREVAVSQTSDSEVKVGSKNISTSISGVSANYFLVRGIKMEKGDEFTQEDVINLGRVAILGASAANKLFGDNEAVGETVRINNVAFKVVGVAAARGSSPSGRDADDMVLVPFTTFSSRLFGVSTLSQIFLQVKDSNQLAQVKQAAESILKERHPAGPGGKVDFQVIIPSVQAQSNFGISTTMTLFLWAVSGISLLVGGIMIMNIMTISVGERTKEIGLRKALGAKRKDILYQFLAEAGIVAAIGGAMGIFVGALLTFLLQYLTGWATSIVWSSVIVALAFATITGIIFGIAPAQKAALMNPVEALRSE